MKGTMIKCYCLSTVVISLFCIFKHASSLNYFRDRNQPTLMQNIIVHNVTGEIFVAARNAIYHFDKNFKVKRKVSTGPILENAECVNFTDVVMLDCNLKAFAEINNDNYILDIYHTHTKDVLFACGTGHHGRCQAMPIENINVQQLVGHSSLDIIVGLAGAVGFFAPGPTQGLSLYSAAAYDSGRFLKPTSSVSSKIPIWKNNTISFNYSHQSETAFTAVVFNYPHYKVNFLYGFSYNGFSYFVTTQKMSIESEVYETRITRVCQNDLEFFSYTEIPIHCQRGLDMFTLATAAHLGPAGEQLRRKLKMAENVKEILYVSFGMTVPDHGPLLDNSKGTVVCSFPMDQVTEAFNNATRDCFQAQPRTHLLQHITKIYKKCDKLENEKDGPSNEEIPISYEDYCGSALNPFIEGRENLPGGFRFHVNTKITSLAVLLQSGKTIAVVGTVNGKVIKELLDKRNDHHLYVHQLRKPNKENASAIHHSNAFDLSYDNIYFLTGDSVRKLY